jgi:hypothetical protein
MCAKIAELRVVPRTIEFLTCDQISMRHKHQRLTKGSLRQKNEPVTARLRVAYGNLQKPMNMHDMNINETAVMMRN